MKPGHVYRNKKMQDVDFYVKSVDARYIVGVWISRKDRRLMADFPDPIVRWRWKDADWEDLGELESIPA